MLHNLKELIDDAQNVTGVAKQKHILQYEDPIEAEEPLYRYDEDDFSDDIDLGGPLQLVDDGSIEDEEEEDYYVKFDPDVIPGEKMEWDAWETRHIPRTDQTQFVLGYDGDSDEDILRGGIFTDMGPKEKVVPPSPETNKAFWSKYNEPNKNVGYLNNRKCVDFHLKGEITRHGTQKKHWKDKVQCNVCGSIYRRNLATQHRKTKKHKQAYDVHQLVLETVLTAQKRKYKKRR